jgi:GntR family transcriptional regulator
MASRSFIKASRARRPKSTLRATASIDVQSDEPLYLQVVHVLKDEIVKGIYPIGSQLPPEEELGRRFSVSRYTIREALRRLREDNLVSSRQGSGTTVASPRPSNAFVHEVTSINDLVAYATGARFAIETIELIKVDRKLASRIGVASGDQWLAVRGCRYMEGIDLPVCWTEVYVNRDFAGIGRLLQRHVGPIFHLVEDLFGQRIAEVNQEIAAARMPQAMTDHLQVKGDDMALEVRRVYRLASSKIALIAINTHPASRFRHSMTMRRLKS